MGRGRGKGKRGGRGGGIGRQFVSSLEELQSRNDKEEAWNARRKAQKEAAEDSEPDDDQGKKKSANSSADKASDGDEESEEDIRDEDGEEKGEDKKWAAERRRAEAILEEQEKERKPKGVSGLIQVDNPNAKLKGARMMKAKDMDMSAPPVELSRRELEAIEAQQKKDAYMKRHAEGKTQESQVDMARLAIVRKRREEAEKKKAAEAATDELEKEKATTAMKTGGGSQMLKLNPLEVKKMNPTRLKELLKEREQSLQGSKKELITRLLEWEKAHHP